MSEYLHEKKYNLNLSLREIYDLLMMVNFSKQTIIDDAEKYDKLISILEKEINSKML